MKNLLSLLLFSTVAYCIQAQQKENVILNFDHTPTLYKDCEYTFQAKAVGYHQTTVAAFNGVVTKIGEDLFRVKFGSGNHVRLTIAGVDTVKQETVSLKSYLFDLHEKPEPILFLNTMPMGKNIPDNPDTISVYYPPSYAPMQKLEIESMEVFSPGRKSIICTGNKLSPEAIEMINKLKQYEIIVLTVIYSNGSNRKFISIGSFVK